MSGAPRQLGSASIGTGVIFDRVQRQYDAFAESNLRNSNSELESQLPSRAEMSALLFSINQLGQKRNLQFELFRPGQVVVKPYYAELPVSIRVSGSYHDFGRFASDVAFLPRIATLGNISIAAKTDTSMAFDATLKTYRYLDAEEAAAQQRKPVEAKK